MDVSELTVVRCTVDQARQTRRNHFSTWGAPLGFIEDDWVRRFEVLESNSWADGDRYESWALVPRKDTETLNMLAHCETFRRPSLAIAPNSNSPREVLSYGIAGVFTPAQNRAHGYARQLLRIVHYIIAPTALLPQWPSAWGEEPKIAGLKDASFSVLYSGVGDKYYASCKRGDGADSQLGWEKVQVTSREWQVPESAGDSEVNSWGEWVAPEGLQALEDRASKTMTDELPTLNSKSHRVAILPRESLFRVHAVRNQQSPSYKAAKDRHFGLIIERDAKGNRIEASGSDGADKRPFIVYTFPEAAGPQTLELIYVQHPVPFEAVVAAAQKEGCTTIRMWGGRGNWDDHGAKLEHDAETACLVVYDNPTKETSWEWLEQYTWC